MSHPSKGYPPTLALLLRFKTRGPFQSIVVRISQALRGGCRGAE